MTANSTCYKSPWKGHVKIFCNLCIQTYGQCLTFSTLTKKNAFVVMACLEHAYELAQYPHNNVKIKTQGSVLIIHSNVCRVLLSCSFHANRTWNFIPQCRHFTYAHVRNESVIKILIFFFYAGVWCYTSLLYHKKHFAQRNFELRQHGIGRYLFEHNAFFPRISNTDFPGTTRNCFALVCILLHISCDAYVYMVKYKNVVHMR